MTAGRLTAGVFLAAVLGAAPAAAQWSNNGPPESVWSLAVSPLDGTVYAGTASRIYRSADHGSTWAPLPAAFDVTRGPAALLVDRRNVLYVSLNNTGGGIWSADGGQTFAPLSLPVDFCNDGQRFAVAPSDSSTIYLARCGIFKSTDAGATWHESTFDLSVYSLAVDPRNPDRLFAGTDWRSRYGGSVVISENGGATWTAAVGGASSVNEVRFDPSDPARIFAVGSSDFGILRSGDAGTSWQRSDAGFSGFGSTAIAFDPVDPHSVYVTAGTSPTPGVPLPAGPPPTGLNQSADGGLTWQRMPSAPYPIALAIDPGGEFLYGWGNGLGVSVLKTRTSRDRVERPSPHRPPRVVPRQAPGLTAKPPD